MNTIIDTGDVFTGTLKGIGLIRIDGELEGSIETKEMLVIGKTGKVKADIKAREVIIGGILIGNINSQEKITIETGAKVSGDINTSIIRIEQGAFYEGKCTMPKSQS